MKTIATLCTILKGDQILLGMKKRRFGAGKWNGFGGKPDAGESIEAAAKREIQEECGIVPNKIEKIGLMEFTYSGADGVYEVHMFVCNDFSGEPIETEEMLPRWFAVSELPYEEMWISDKLWMPLLLAGKKFKGQVAFNDGQIISQQVEVVEKI